MSYKGGIISSKGTGLIVLVTTIGMGLMVVFCFPKDYLFKIDNIVGIIALIGCFLFGLFLLLIPEVLNRCSFCGKNVKDEDNIYKTSDMQGLVNDYWHKCCWENMSIGDKNYRGQLVDFNPKVSKYEEFDAKEDK